MIWNLPHLHHVDVDVVGFRWFRGAWKRQAVYSILTNFRMSSHCLSFRVFSSNRLEIKRFDKSSVKNLKHSTLATKPPTSRRLLSSVTRLFRSLQLSRLSRMFSVESCHSQLLLLYFFLFIVDLESTPKVIRFEFELMIRTWNHCSNQFLNN